MTRPGHLRYTADSVDRSLPESIPQATLKRHDRQAPRHSTGHQSLDQQLTGLRPSPTRRVLSGRPHNYSDVIRSHTSIRLREMVPLTKGAECHEPARTASPWPKPSGQNSKPARVDIRHRIRKLCGPGSCSTRPKAWATTRSPHA